MGINHWFGVEHDQAFSRWGMSGTKLSYVPSAIKLKWVVAVVLDVHQTLWTVSSLFSDYVQLYAILHVAFMYVWERKREIK